MRRGGEDGGRRGRRRGRLSRRGHGNNLKKLHISRSYDTLLVWSSYLSSDGNFSSLDGSLDLVLADLLAGNREVLGAGIGTARDRPTMQSKKFQFIFSNYGQDSCPRQVLST